MNEKEYSRYLRELATVLVWLSAVSVASVCVHVIPDNDRSSAGTVPSAAVLVALLVAEHSFFGHWLYVCGCCHVEK